MAVQGTLERFSCVDDVAGRAHLFSYWFPESACCVPPVGVDLSNVQRWGAADYGIAGASWLEFTGGTHRGSYNETVGYELAQDLIRQTREPRNRGSLLEAMV